MLKQLLDVAVACGLLEARGFDPSKYESVHPAVDAARRSAVNRVRNELVRAVELAVAEGQQFATADSSLLSSVSFGGSFFFTLDELAPLLEKEVSDPYSLELIHPGLLAVWGWDDGGRQSVDNYKEFLREHGYDRQQHSTE